MVEEEENTEKRSKMNSLFQAIFPNNIRKNAFTAAIKGAAEAVKNGFNQSREDFGKAIEKRMPENGEGFSDIVANGNGKHQET